MLVDDEDGSEDDPPEPQAVAVDAARTKVRVEEFAYAEMPVGRGSVYDYYAAAFKATRKNTNVVSTRSLSVTKDMLVGAHACTRAHCSLVLRAVATGL